MLREQVVVAEGHIVDPHLHGQLVGGLSVAAVVAIDKACIDLVKGSNDTGKEHFMDRVISRNGEHTIEIAAKLGIGVKEYELIEI